MRKLFYCLIAVLSFSNAYAEKILNIYAWSGEVPDFIVKRFEQETGIKVNFSTYENNEVMYTKLKATKNLGYDLIMPSSYFVDRMRKENMLEPIDKSRLALFHNINSHFYNPSYDPQSKYSIPHLWSITGIFTNKNAYPAQTVTKWKDLWAAKFENKLLMLDDTREMFSMALLSLGYSANDTDPKHIRQAFEALKKLMPNIKVFSSDTVISIIIDEDANVGMAWNGDGYKAATENAAIQFTYPEEGFVISVDTFAIPKGAPHQKEAYAFLNFVLRADIAKDIAMVTGYATANAAGQKLLPEQMKNNSVIYPSEAVMNRGEYLRDVGDATLALYEQYWAELKMSA